jgi:CBS-domain-containing membrane protein
MKVRDIMQPEVITVGLETTFVELVDKLLTHDISGLPVVDGEGRLLGIVTEADLVSKGAYGYRRRRALGLVADYLRGRDPQWVRKASGRTAGEVMTTAAATAGPDEEVGVAARRMLENRLKRLPVVEDGRLVGILTRHDLLQPYHRSDGAILADLDRLLADPLRVPERHEVRPSVAAGVVTLEGTAMWPSDVVLLEAVVARIPGVVAVENRLSPREAEPRLTGPVVPRLR